MIPPSWRKSILPASLSFFGTLLVASLVCWIIDRKDAPASSTTLSPSEPTPSASFAKPAKPALPPSSLAAPHFPTDRTNLFDSVITNAYVPTNAEIPETALFGSARTGSDGRPRFHKGIDIAPVLPRTRSAEPTDPVYAVADGTVLYINRVGGNSSYGAHVVLLHKDPVGQVYSLYAHLASVTPKLKKGDTIRKGDTLGILGRTSSATRIPTWNAHLHFEMGLLHNGHFHAWERKKGGSPIRGNGHGWNLLAIDSRAILQEATQSPAPFSVLTHLKAQNPACSLVLHLSKTPDFFRLYPSLWFGQPLPPSGAPVVLHVSESGLILSGRLANATEAELLTPTSKKRPRVQVLSVDPERLGRNGLRLVVKSNGNWTFGTNNAAQRWLELLLF